MSVRHPLAEALLGRPVAAAYGVIVALYLLRHVRVQPLQIPAYLLIVSYDFVEVALPAITPYHPIGFPIYLYALAVVGGAVARRVPAGSSRTPAWQHAIGGVCLLIGVLAAGFGAVVGGPVVSPTDNPTPLAITGTTAVLFAIAAWWLLRGRSNGSNGEPDPGS